MPVCPVPAEAALRRHAPLLDAYLTAPTADAGLSRSGPQTPSYGRADHCWRRAVDGGLDTVKQQRGTLARAEHLAARLWNSDFARFSVGARLRQPSVRSLGRPTGRTGCRASHSAPFTAARPRARRPRTGVAAGTRRILCGDTAGSDPMTSGKRSHHIPTCAPYSLATRRTSARPARRRGRRGGARGRQAAHRRRGVGRTFRISPCAAATPHHRRSRRYGH